MQEYSVSGTVTYVLLRCLGQGLSGCVYKAIRKDSNHHLEQVVTLKILNSENLVESWRREFESLLRVESRFCRRLFGFDWINDKPCLVLEYVDGLSLQEIKQRCYLSEGEIDEISRQIQMGLIHLKRNGLFHGDLSPGNVLINGKGQVKLVDFGLGNVDDEGVRATPPFIAPEVASGDSTSGFAADLFGLGQLRQYLRGDDAWLSFQSEFADKATGEANFLHRDPKQRRTRYFDHRRRQQRQLGEKVQEIQRVMEASQLRTQPLFQSSDTEGVMKASQFRPLGSYFKQVSLVSRVLLLALLLFVGPQSQVYSQPTWNKQMGSLKVRTRKWVEVWVNGTRHGFSPVDISLTIPGEYLIHWRTSQSRGSRSLTIVPGKNIVLDDHFFQ